MLFKTRPAVQMRLYLFFIYNLYLYIPVRTNNQPNASIVYHPLPSDMYKRMQKPMNVEPPVITSGT
jgi:hypothetical protein